MEQQKVLSEFEKKFLGAELGKLYLRRGELMDKWYKFTIEDIVVIPIPQRNPKTEIYLVSEDKRISGWTALTIEQANTLKRYMTEIGIPEFLELQAEPYTDKKGNTVYKLNIRYGNRFF